MATSRSDGKRRRDLLLDQLAGKDRVICPQGGWSMLLDVADMGLRSEAASKLLLEKGKVAATPMRNWGMHHGDRYVRLVFSNEPAARLQDIRRRFDRAFA